MLISCQKDGKEVGRNYKLTQTTCIHTYTDIHTDKHRVTDHSHTDTEKTRTYMHTHIHTYIDTYIYTNIYT
jgi:hypothetical protein